MNKLITAAMLLAAAPLAAQCPLPAAGTSKMLNGVIFDDWTAAQPLGFAFPFKGTTYDGIFVSDHGVCSLTDFATGAPAAPPAVPWTYSPDTAQLTSQPGPIISPYWSDHSISYGTNVGEIWIENTNGVSCTISWIDAETYIDGAPFSVSVTLHVDGSIDFTYDNRVNNEGSTFGALNAICGIGVPGGVSVTANLDTDVVVASDSFFEEFVTTAPLTPNPLFDIADSTIKLIDAGIGGGWVIIKSTLPCSSTTATGVGCDGLSLASTAPPAVGTDWAMTLSGVGAAAVSFGLPNWLVFGAPIPAAPIGVLLPDFFGPACMAYQDASLGLVDIGTADAAGDVFITITIPPTITLVGADATCQGLTIRDLFVTPTFSLSNGMTGVVGF